MVKWVKNRGTFEDLKTFFVITWSLWGWRNKRLYEQRVKSPFSVIERVLSFCSLHAETSTSHTGELRNLNRWQLPPYEYFKLNVDGALFLDYKVASISAILRDNFGAVILAAIVCEYQVETP